LITPALLVADLQDSLFAELEPYIEVLAIAKIVLKVTGYKTCVVEYIRFNC